jgi:hypothetical protein
MFHLTNSDISCFKIVDVLPTNFASVNDPLWKSESHLTEKLENESRNLEFFFALVEVIAQLICAIYCNVHFTQCLF